MKTSIIFITLKNKTHVFEKYDIYFTKIKGGVFEKHQQSNQSIKSGEVEIYQNTIRLKQILS